MVQVLARENSTECGKWIDHDCLDKTVVYTFTQSNPSPGIIEILIIGTENPSGTEVYNNTITFGNLGQNTITIDENTGVITYTEVSDIDGSTNVITVNLETWLQNQLIGAGATTVTWDSSQFVISSEDDASTVTPGTDVDGNPTWTYQPVDNDGNPNGAAVVITDTNTTNTGFTLNSTNPAILELTDSDGNIVSIDLTPAICAIMQGLPEETC